MRLDIDLKWRTSCTVDQFRTASKLRFAAARRANEQPDDIWCADTTKYFADEIDDDEDQSDEEWWYVEPGVARIDDDPDEEDDRQVIVNWPQENLTLDKFLEVAAMFVKCGGAISFYGGGDHAMQGYYQLVDGRDMPAASAYLQVRDEKITETLARRIEHAVRTLRGWDDDDGK